MSIGINTVFGQYSSGNGQIFPYGYTDIASGESFARTGVKSPIPGSGEMCIRDRILTKPEK